MIPKVGRCFSVNDAMCCDWNPGMVLSLLQYLLVISNSITG